jgi:succinate-semialdehyde dehydrogenase/glutarate-semialdehyde dehydrogenase
MLKKSHHLKREANLIGGEWVEADSGAAIEVVNPATGEAIGTVPKAGRAETRRAVEAAQAAFESFRQTTAAERAKWLRDLHGGASTATSSPPPGATGASSSPRSRSA